MDNGLSKIGQYTQLAFLLPVSALVGYVMGHFLDKFFHTDFLYLVFLGLGIVAGLVEAIRETQTDGTGKS